MKHLLLLSILFAICNIHAFGQNITLTFLGENSFNNAPLTIDSVQIINNTNGTDTLVAGNIFSILITSLEILDDQENNNIVVYPNPFDNSANIILNSNFYERAQINVFSVNGRKIAEWNDFIRVGENKLLLESNVTGVLFLTIYSQNLRLKAKLICNKSSRTADLKLIDNSYSPITNYKIKSGSNLYNTFEYRSGDSLTFIGYSGEIVSETIHDIPDGDKTYTLIFDVTNYLPVANFDVSTQNINEGSSISFFDQTTNSPTSWEWDFGDGNSSTVQNPTHTYTTAGVYTVKLIATNSFGADTITKTNYITVNSLVPVADFSANNTTINQGDAVIFSDLSANNPTSWEWDFGDGNTSTVQNPNHTYATAGVYTVQLIVANSVAADTITKTNYITVNSLVPVADFSANKTTINQGDAVNFSDQSTNNPTSWLWDFGDGNTSTVQNPTHTYTTAGVYTVQLIVANSVAADTITKTNYITVNSLVPVAEFSANKTTINQGDAVIFSDLSANNPTSWEWDFGDGNTSTVQNPNHTYATAGVYTVQLIVANSVAADTITKTNYITVNSLVPVAEFSANKTTINQGDAVSFSDQSVNNPTSWEWDFGDGNSSTVQNPTHTYSTAGVYSVKLIATSNVGADTITKTNYITVNSMVPVAEFSANKTTINQGSDIIFSDQTTNNPTSWVWDFGDGNTSTVQNPNHTYATAGVYTVQLIVANSVGADTITKTDFITVNSLVPVAEFSANKTTINQGDAVSFSDQSANNPTSWEWDFGDGNTSTVQNPNHTYATAGVYTVQLIVANSVAADTITKTNYITVNSLVPVAEFSANKTTINQGDAVFFSDQSVNNPTSWEWDFGDVNTSTVQNPTHTYSSAGVYTVQLIATNTVGADTITKTDYITVNSLVPVAEFSANKTTINQGDAVIFSDQSTNNPTSWLWDFGDGSTSTVQNPTHIYTTAGVYSVKLIATSNVGADTITKTDYITVNSLVPVAEFSANKTTINQGDAVVFSDQTTNNPTSWEWDFGDGNTSTVQNPTHSYSTAGVYSVKLIATSNVGADTITKTDYITVNSLVPVAEFSANKTTINQGDAVSFSDQSANNPTSLEWDFGDGNTSTVQNPTHTYSSAGVYTVQLIATNSVGVDTITKTDFITVNSLMPVAEFSANKTTINQGDAVVFSDQSVNNPTSWEWDFGDGNTSTVQNPTHNYLTTGTFTVKLIVNNSFGSDTTIKEALIKVNSAVPSAAFSANTAIIDQGNEIIFSDQSANFPTSWLWNFGDGSTSTIQNPTHIYTSAGLFTVKLIVVNSFGTDTITKTDFITVNSLVPVAEFSADKTTINQGDAVIFSDQSANNPTSWNWDFGDGNTSNVQHPTHTYPTAGVYTIKLIVGNDFGADTITKTDFIAVYSSNVPIASFSANKTNEIQGNEIIFSDQSTNSPTSWLWDFGDGNTSTVQNPTHTYLSAGTYSVKLTVSNSFGSDSIINENFIIISSPTPPVVAFSSNTTTIDQGHEIIFSDQSTNSPTSWLWDFGDGNTSTVQNPTHTYLTAGTFTVTLTVTNVFGSDTMIKNDLITVNSAVPVAAFSVNTTIIDQGNQIIFSDQSTNSPTSWEWDFGDGNTSTVQNPTHTYLTAGTFTVTLTATNSFGSDTIIKQDLITVNSAVPVAAFSANNIVIDQGNQIVFSDQSTNSPTSWLWDFGDGNTSTVENPTHTYLTSGTFTVTLMVTNEFGSDTMIKQNLITVNSAVPVAAFSANNTVIDQGNQIVFSDQSTNSPTSWEWDFGDGTTSTIQNPTHTYLAAGTFTVTLTVTNVFGSDTMIKQNLITVNSAVPVAAFSTNTAVIDQGNQIIFSDQSTNSPTSWFWDFGDGNTSTVQNPTHIYLTAGTFTLKLTVTNDFGSDTMIKQNLITVNSAVPVAAFSANTAVIDQGGEIIFSDQSTNSPTSWLWDFGDGNTSTVKNPTHTYLTAGTFTVKLTVTNDFGFDTMIKQNLITVNSAVPVAAFSANNTVIDQGNQIVFSDQSTNSPTSWLWDFGDGTSSTAQNPTHTYLTAGTFTVTLTVTNVFGSDTMIKQNLITVNSAVPVAAFSANTTIIDQGNQIIFSDQSTNSPTSWEWDFGDGNTSTVQNPTHTYLTAGTFTVKLTVTNDFGSDTMIKQNLITVNSAVPVAAFSANNTVIDQGNQVIFSDQSTNSPTSWLWDFGDGNTSTVQNPTHIYLTAGTFTVKLTVTNDFGSDTMIKQNLITVNSAVPVAAFSANNTVIDQGNQVIFSDQSTNSPTSWLWDFGDGTSSTAQNPTHTYLTAGTFTLKLTVTNNFGSDTVIKLDLITVNSAIPVAAFSANTTIIDQGNQIIFSDQSTNSPTSWLWDFGDGNTSTVQNPTHTYLTAGTFTLTLTVTNVFGSDTMIKNSFITVNSLAPIAQFSADERTIIQGNTVTFLDQSTNSPTSWEWDFGDGNTSTVQNPTHSYIAEGLYTVKLVASNSFGPGTIVKTDYIEVLPIPDPVLSVSPIFLDFDTISTQKYISINNIGGNVLTWSFAENLSWLTVDLASGETTTETDQVGIVVDRTNLSAGDYSGIITITSNGGTQEVNIIMNVRAKEEPKPPGWTN